MGYDRQRESNHYFAVSTYVAIKLRRLCVTFQYTRKKRFFADVGI
jgi:hypothetical protein